MLDFFAVITKGGIVLWYFQDAAAHHLSSSIVAINALITNVILQERSGLSNYNYENLNLKMKLDNEYDLLYIAIHQKILQLSYVDKFLSDMQRQFRDRYKQPLEQGLYFQSFDFSAEYHSLLVNAEQMSQLEKTIAHAPRTFEQSEKSKKKVDSMIERRGNEDKKPKKSTKKNEGKSKKSNQECNNNNKGVKVEKIIQNNVMEDNNISEVNEISQETNDLMGPTKDEIKQKLDNLRKRGNVKYGGKVKSPKQLKKGKEARMWELDGKDCTTLDYSKKSVESNGIIRPVFLPNPNSIGTLSGELQAVNLSVESEKKTGGVFAMFKGLVGGKTLTDSDLMPVLEKLKEHLIGKNVATEIADKLCDSVNAKLEGKHIGTFEGVSSLVRTTLTDALVLLLTPKRRLDILRDVNEAIQACRPYTITFCGVNGVGKSTNLAKVSFWLIENNLRVLIAACDTFRAGAVEQLRTHTRHLNALHPADKHNGRLMVELYEQGYGKDASDIARHSVEYARKNDIDVVLIDTAGRMQDNEPLMRALAKLIHINEPDLTLFVGEALVGNEAVDQLVKFNRALSNYSTSNRPQMIDGIVLTKFDTIDDKVGAAISMTYITGQPIVFIGTGQTYTDLKSLDSKAVVASLMK